MKPKLREMLDEIEQLEGLEANLREADRLRAEAAELTSKATNILNLSSERQTRAMLALGLSLAVFAVTLLMVW